MNGYLDNTAMSDGIAGYITLPALGSKAGMLGAIALAESVLPESDSSSGHVGARPFVQETTG